MLLKKGTVGLRFYAWLNVYIMLIQTFANQDESDNYYHIFGLRYIKKFIKVMRIYN